MRLRPPSAEMIEGETNRLIFNLAPAVGGNTITGTPTIECDDLTFTTPSVSGTNVTTFVSGGEAGRDYIVTITTVLSSGETKVAAITLEWKEPGFDSRAAA